MSKENLIGKVFEKLTVVEASERRTSSGSILYRCICMCGGETYTTARNLRTGHTKSCGCNRKEKFKKYSDSLRNELANKKFGRLKAVKAIGKDKYRNIIWECICDCGKTVPVLSQSLVSGNTTSCGCISIEGLQEKSKKNLFDNTNVAIINALIKDNKSKITASGVKGVSWVEKRNKWRSYIIFQKKYHHLGYFSDLEKAKEIRKEAEQKLFAGFLEWFNSINK